MHQKIVFTGGPGAGKSTVLAALQERGCAVVADHAREVIRKRKASGLSPRPGPAAFAQEILRLDIEAYERTASIDGPVFFERSVLDAVGGLHEAGGLTSADL